MAYGLKASSCHPLTLTIVNNIWAPLMTSQVDNIKRMINVDTDVN